MPNRNTRATIASVCSMFDLVLTQQEESDPVVGADIGVNVPRHNKVVPGPDQVLKPTEGQRMFPLLFTLRKVSDVYRTMQKAFPRN